MNDLISRAAAIDAVCEMVKECFGADEEEQTAIAVTIRNLPSAQPYTDEEIQAMQDLEQAQLDKAYQIGVEEGLKSAQPEQECEKCIFKPFKQFQPERKTGRWIPHEDEDGEHYGDKCSECGEWYVMPYGKTRFCPNCGAEMEVSES